MTLNHTSEFAELTEAQYALLGKAVVEWANIELLLSILLSRLLATPEFLARTYTDSISAVKLQDAILEAVEIHQERYRHRLISEETLLEILDINFKITNLRSARNKIAHFCWSRNSDQQIFGTNFRGGVHSEKRERRDFSILTSQDLAKLNCDAHALVEQMINLVSKLPEVTEESLLAKHLKS